MTVNDKGKYLAFGDDNGEVTVIDIEENKPMKKLMNGHKNVSEPTLSLFFRNSIH